MGISNSLYFFFCYEFNLSIIIGARGEKCAW